MTLASGATRKKVSKESPETPRPPETRRHEVREELHGVEIVDPYRWLEDQDSPETRAWLEAQVAYTRSQLDGRPGHTRVKQRLSELLQVDNIGVPTERNGAYFLFKRRAEEQQYILYRRQGLHGDEEVLLDPHTLSDDTTTSIVLEGISQDGTLVIYGLRQGGADEIEVRLLDVDTHQDLPDRLPYGLYYGISLKPDKSGFYYSRSIEYRSRIYYHAMGTDPADDLLLFGEDYGPDKVLIPFLSEDGRYLLITVYYGSAGQKSEVYIQNIAEGGPFVPIVTDIDAEFLGTIVEDALYLQTNWQAPHGRILRVDLKNPAQDAWQEIVPPGPDALTNFSLIGGRLFVNYLRNVTTQIRVFTPDGVPAGEVTLPAPGTASGLSGRWSSLEAFFTFTSFPSPLIIYRYDLATGAQEVFARQEVPIEADRFVVDQVWYTSRDGVRVPMFLVHARDLPRDGNRPVLLTGYGGFNRSLTPEFSAVATLWAEQGGVYALANLRGGGEFGEEWHRSGMLENKQNVFDDFIAAAEWLIREKYTCPARLAMAGGSNGGLLVGAAMTQRPDLFQAVICSVPLLDMLRYHQFLVAQYWVPEYGSAEDPMQFQTLYAYSPYHHVRPGTAYPATLLVTGDADTRVAPLHARKMTALLQSATSSDRPILLHYDTKAGHVGSKPLQKQIADMADEQSFLFWQLGVSM